jgi:hypothetical protein
MDQIHGSSITRIKHHSDQASLGSSITRIKHHSDQTTHPDYHTMVSNQKIIKENSKKKMSDINNKTSFVVKKTASDCAADCKAQRIKTYRRSLNRIYIAKYMEREFSIPFMNVCAKLEDKDKGMTKFIKKLKDELVEAKFPSDEEERPKRPLRYQDMNEEEKMAYLAEKAKHNKP